MSDSTEYHHALSATTTTHSSSAFSDSTNTTNVAPSPSNRFNAAIISKERANERPNGRANSILRMDQNLTPSRSHLSTSPSKLSSHRHLTSPAVPHGSPLHSAPNSPSSIRTLSSAIFSSRDPALPPPSSPTKLDFSGSSVGAVRELWKETGKEGDGLLMRKMGHRRTTTAPSLTGALGSNSMDNTALGLDQDDEMTEVAGVPGRVRLSRAVDSAAFSPSSVFSSARYGSPLELASPKARPASAYSLQTPKIMEQSRQNLVAYEYLCHLYEARAWLDANITSRDGSTPLWSDSVGGFEQSLRNGYALAHLARSLGGIDGGIFNVRICFPHLAFLTLTCRITHITPCSIRLDNIDTLTTLICSSVLSKTLDYQR